MIHLYLGVFTAPMLLFFAITGGLQSFSLHEATRGSSYAPPAWLASAAQFHKKQTTVMPVRRRQPPETVPLVGAPTLWQRNRRKQSSRPRPAPPRPDPPRPRPRPRRRSGSLRRPGRRRKAICCR